MGSGPGVTLATFRVSFRGPTVSPRATLEDDLAAGIAAGLDCWAPGDLERTRRKRPGSRARTSSPPRAARVAAWARKEAADAGRPPPEPAKRHKTCSTCRRSKPADTQHFYTRALSSDGLQSTCVDCSVKRDKKRARLERASAARLARGEPTELEGGRVVSLDVFGDPVGGELPEPGAMSDALARTFRAYEREERERAHYAPDPSSPTGVRALGRVPREPKEDPRDVWTADDERALDAELDRILGPWVESMREEERVLRAVIDWRRKVARDGEQEEQEEQGDDGWQREGGSRRLGGG